MSLRRWIASYLITKEAQMLINRLVNQRKKGKTNPHKGSTSAGAKHQ
ncbi:MAG TPA: hypothetical protein VFT71_08155 [Candidatus Nitrosocosmicus sp.]|nr:hypothetical protein [Candidatus Nitrosocosmicus sp.]